MKKTFLIIAAIIFIQPLRSFAWGRDGHNIIAEIAYRILSDKTRSNVSAFLGSTTFEDASVWMDEMRGNSEYDYMKPWHYINIEKGHSYIPNSEENIINELLLQQKELSNIKALKDEQVKTDLMILFHLIGDLHQPLHVGYAIDRGGNTVEINFEGEPTNLHAVWGCEFQNLVGLRKVERIWLRMYDLPFERVFRFHHVELARERGGICGF